MGDGERKGLRRYLANALLGGVIDEIVEERIAASAVKDEDEGWRRLTGDSTRDLSPLKQERMFQICYWLWENNPLAKWLIEIIKDFVLADGLPYEAKNDDVKAALDEFWYDPINKMDLYGEKHIRENFIFGELCLPAFVGENSGRVRLGYIDPANIKEAVTDPGNVKMVIGVILKSQGGEKERHFRTILPKEADEVLTPKAKAMRETYEDGQCFYFTINNLTNSARGRSELLGVADWCDAYEQFLFDHADKSALLNMFVWDLEVQGANQEDLKEWKSLFSKQSGSVFAHNEKVKVAAPSPNLKSYEADKNARLFRNHIMGSMGLPEHWYGGAGDVNLATAVEMGTPAFKTLSAKQRYIKYVFEDIFTFVIQCRLDAGTLNVDEKEAWDWSIITPELATKDVSKYSAAIQQLAAALVAAENQGWIDQATSRNVFIQLVGYLGIELNAQDIEQALKVSREKKGYEDYNEEHNGE